MPLTRDDLEFDDDYDNIAVRAVCFVLAVVARLGV